MALLKSKTMVLFIVIMLGVTLISSFNNRKMNDSIESEKLNSIAININ